MDESARAEGTALSFSNHPTVKKIEAYKRYLRSLSEPVMDHDGVAGPYDQQLVSQALRGSKDRSNCLRLAEFGLLYGSGGVVELGTNLGVSSAYLAVGAREANKKASLVTGDCSGKRLGIAKKCTKNAALIISHIYRVFLRKQLR